MIKPERHAKGGSWFVLAEDPGKSFLKSGEIAAMTADLAEPAVWPVDPASCIPVDEGGDVCWGKHVRSGVRGLRGALHQKLANCLALSEGRRFVSALMASAPSSQGEGSRRPRRWRACGA